MSLITKIFSVFFLVYKLWSENIIRTFTLLKTHPKYLYINIYIEYNIYVLQLKYHCVVIALWKTIFKTLTNHENVSVSKVSHSHQNKQDSGSPQALGWYPQVFTDGQEAALTCHTSIEMIVLRENRNPSTFPDNDCKWLNFSSQLWTEAPPPTFDTWWEHIHVA